MYSLSMAPYSDNFTSQTIIKESSVHRSLLHYKTGCGLAEAERNGERIHVHVKSWSVWL